MDKRQAYNDESIDEQGLMSGSIPDTTIQWQWAEKKSVQFGHRQCSLRCGECGSALAMKGKTSSHYRYRSSLDGLPPDSTGRHPAPQPNRVYGDF
ncbi:hypothetical protein [Buttiauxella gaviniae]|uniref:hypothetical protein n=1 Tax=Buttiauxella gaviniae TaxID=82990 RepID=UPI0012EDD644|nr:hypothetical protein [Buttiauxella gaviniae]